MTVADWLRKWLAMREKSLAGQSFDRYKHLVQLHLIPGLGATQLRKLTPAAIAEFYATKSHLAPRTQRYIHAVLNSAIKRAIKLRLIAVNPAADLHEDLPKIERRQTQALSPQQTMALLEAAAGTDLYAPILLAVATGGRRNECLALRWRHIDEGSVLIAESLEHRRGMDMRAKAPKSDKFRRIALPAVFADRLRRRKIEQAEMLLKLGMRAGPDTLVCTRADGSAMTPAMLTCAFPRLAMKVLGIGTHFHVLRHSHASALLLAGVQPKVVQERLGHSSIVITLDTYSHLIDGMQEEAAARLDRVFCSNLIAKGP